MYNENTFLPQNVSSIMRNLRETLGKFTIKETEWMMERSNLEKRIAELDGQVKCHETINIDLMKRIRLLEYAVQNQTPLVNSNPGRQQFASQNLIPSDEISKQREKLSKHSLLKLLFN